VLELGAAAAVPSIISALCGARTVVASDYPDPRIVDVMQLNMKENGKVLSENGSVAPQVCGNNLPTLVVLVAKYVILWCNSQGICGEPIHANY
jgi:predicted nicotinamide N-methyase